MIHLTEGVVASMFKKLPAPKKKGEIRAMVIGDIHEGSHDYFGICDPSELAETRNIQFVAVEKKKGFGDIKLYWSLFSI